MNTHTYVIDTLLCHGGGPPGSAGWVAKRKIDCSARGIVREGYAHSAATIGVGLANDRLHRTSTSKRATVRLSRTECQYTMTRLLQLGPCGKHRLQHSNSSAICLREVRTTVHVVIGLVGERGQVADQVYVYSRSRRSGYRGPIGDGCTFGILILSLEVS